MAYFKLSLLNKILDKTQTKYIKNTISEFYGNNLDEDKDLIRFQKGIPDSDISNRLDSIYTKTYSYNEKLVLHQQAQKELTFSLDKMILDDNEWKENPFASLLRIGCQLLLEDKYSNLYLFTIKDVSYVINENNIIYNFTCQDSFSYQLSKQNDGYTIKNDINSKDFIGALNIDSWAKKIKEECKIPYVYLPLSTPLYLMKDGTASKMLVQSSGNVEKILKPIFTVSNDEDLFETFPFSCSGTTANGALISLGEQIGLMVNTATVLEEVENDNSIVSIETYFWFEPAKKGNISGLLYSPFRDIKTFTLSQTSDSLITMLNVESRTLDSGEVITALPEPTLFFKTLFESAYWKNYVSYYPGLYTTLLYGTILTLDKANSVCAQYGTVTTTGKVSITTTISEEQFLLYKLYDKTFFENLRTISDFIFVDVYGETKIIRPSSGRFSFSCFKDNNEYKAQVIIENDDLKNIEIEDDEMNVISYQIYVFLKKDYTTDDMTFAKAADDLPWLENKLIDFNFFYNNKILSSMQTDDLYDRLYQKLRKANSEVLLKSNAYYAAIHKQTQILADMTNDIDLLGAKASNISSLYKTQTKVITGVEDFLSQWWMVKSNLTSSKNNVMTLINLYDTTSDYMRKFISARQRVFNGIYNFRKYFEAPLDDRYKKTKKIRIELEDNLDLDLTYKFDMSTQDRFKTLNSNFVWTHQDFFTIKPGATQQNILDYVIGIKNLDLYINNSSKTSFLDINQYVLTQDNVEEISVHRYENQYVLNGEKSAYNKDAQYLRQVYFIPVADLMTLLSWPTTTPGSNCILKISLDYNGQTSLSGTIRIFTDDPRLFVISKIKESDDIPTKFVITGGKTVDGTYTVLQNVDITAKVVTLNNYTSSLDNYYSVDIFYQPISENEILKSYLLYKNIGKFIKTENNYIDLHDKILDPGAFLIDSSDYTTVATSSAPNYSNSSTPVVAGKIGWRKTTVGSIIESVASMVPKQYIDYAKQNITNQYVLLRGGFKTAINDRAIYRPEYGTLTNYAGYGSITAAKHKFNCETFINFPLKEVYYYKKVDGKKTYTKIQLVTKFNYTDYLTPSGNNKYSYGNGTLKDLNSEFTVGNEKLKNYVTDFIGDFPRWHFYCTKEGTTFDDLHDILYNYERGVGFTFGNILHSLSLNSSSHYMDPLPEDQTVYDYDGNIYYKLDKKYTKVGANDTIIPECKYLVTPADYGPSLDQYFNYLDIVNGTVKSGNEITVADTYKYLITDADVKAVSDYAEIRDNTIYDINGKEFDINNYYQDDNILRGIYNYVEKVEINMSINDEDENHRLDLEHNPYILYNNKNEIVYTINQIWGNLLYKDYSAYSGIVFNEDASRKLKIYRYSAEDIPMAEIHNFDLTITPNTSYTDEDGVKYRLIIESGSTLPNTISTNGDFIYYCQKNNVTDAIFLDHCALIESTLQQYWSQASSASLLCDIFIPEEWRSQVNNVGNKYNVILYKNNHTLLNTKWVPEIKETKIPSYTIQWKNVVTNEDRNSLILSYNQLEYEEWKKEIDNLIKYTGEGSVSVNDIYFTKILDLKSFYSIESGGSTWTDFFNEAIEQYISPYGGWYGIAISYLTSRYIDAGLDEYKLAIEERDAIWSDLFRQYPFLFLESSYSNESATTCEELLQMAKYTFEDLKYPEKNYSISIIDLVKDVESLDDKINGRPVYNPNYYSNIELKIGESIKIAADDYVDSKDEIYIVLSQLLFITDISRDLRNDGNCQLTVNTIKYQDKLIRRLAKLIKKNSLNG